MASKTVKLVTFNEISDKVMKMVSWKFAYKQSRKRYWKQFFDDRMRFEHTISFNVNIHMKYIITYVNLEELIEL